MSQTTVVAFAGDQPTRENVEFALEDFFNGAAAVWDNIRDEHDYDTFYVILPGLPKAAFDRTWTPPAVTVQQQPKRWIEVTWGKGLWVSFTTRMQDEYTGVLARALAAAFARRWKGRVEEN